MQPKTIDSIPSELLLLMLDHLSSLDKVRSLSICKRWLEIFDDNQVLWRVLMLPQRDGGWSSSAAIELFDRRSATTLTEIKMDISTDSEAVEHFVEILGKQKDTLQILHLRAYSFGNETVSEIFSDLNGLLDCRFARVHDNVISKVRLLTDGIHREDESTRNKTGLKLKILWNPTFGAVVSNAHLLCNLVSFHTSHHLELEILWTLFKQCSQTLKHLNITIARESGKPFQDIEFPQLQVFELECTLGSLPTWMKIPFSVTLVCLYQLPSLPSVSTIWLHDLILGTYPRSALAMLAIRCPEVAEIVVEKTDYQGENNDLTSTECQLFNAMLRQRRHNVAAGMEVDGIRMRNLKRLVVPFTNLTDEDLFDLRELAEEVVDLNTVQRFIEVEI